MSKFPCMIQLLLQDNTAVYNLDTYGLMGYPY